MGVGCDMLSRLSRYAVESYLEQFLSHGFFHADLVSCLILYINIFKFSSTNDLQSSNKGI